MLSAAVLGSASRLSLLLAPQCSYADRTRTPTAPTMLARCLDEVGLTVPVVERVGDYPSPTMLVNRVDVMTGPAGTAHVQAYRLDPPTPQRAPAARHSQPSAG
jgi:hypothetical protein